MCCSIIWWIDEMSRQPFGLDLPQDVNPFQQGNVVQLVEQEMSSSTMTDEERENCRKFRLTVFYKMALVWAKKKKFPSSDGGGPSLHYLNSCSMYWPRRDLMRVVWLMCHDRNSCWCDPIASWSSLLLELIKVKNKQQQFSLNTHIYSLFKLVQ